MGGGGFQIRPWVSVLAVCALGCSTSAPPAPPSPPPSILLVTLDTTRADALQPESPRASTPAFVALAARGRRYLHAYATAPMTLPAHASMMTGLYPAGHGVHENGRTLDTRHGLIAERLKTAGYATAAFVSGYPLDRQFGLARGFDVYDDELAAGSAGRAERSAPETTARALAYLARASSGPVFLWVHYYDPHEPYEPPEPYRSRHLGEPYLGEVEAMDAELGRLVATFSARGPHRILVLGDHGEGLGEHGEAFHGNLLYQGVMRVPLVIAGDGVAAATVAEPVSARGVFDTVLGWAERRDDRGLLAPGKGPVDAVVLGEAMKPFLDHGWQPQVMGVAGTRKVIRSGETEVYDVVADPAEVHDLYGKVEVDRVVVEAMRTYPLPAAGGAPAALGQEQKAQLAALGYVASESPAPVRADAPSPRAMAHLFADLDLAAGLFTRERYAEVVPVCERLLAADPRNFTVALRLAVAHSMLGHRSEAEKAFDRAEAIAPDAPDLEHYRALHLVRIGDWERAAPLLEGSLAASPDRLPALEALARIRVRQRRLPEALRLLERIAAQRRDPVPVLLEQGALAMEIGDTATALSAYERARAGQGDAFDHHLELGVLYLDAGRLEDARASLDRVPPSHPAYAMALFKRAQVSVLLNEPDRAERIRRAREGADESTRALIARERLFMGL